MTVQGRGGCMADLYSRRMNVRSLHFFSLFLKINSLTRVIFSLNFLKKKK